MAIMHKNPPRRVLGVLALTLLSVSAIVSLRNLPLMGLYGWSAVFFYTIAALLFLIPSALVSAELATGWQKDGGVYAWTSEAFGDRWGFAGIWAAWTTSIVLFPTIMSFAAASLAFVINPLLVESQTFIFWVTLAIFWFITFINFAGMKVSAWFSSIGTTLGTIIPGILIIVLALYWLWNGHPVEITFSWAALVPDFNLQNIVFFAGVILGFSGMEITAYHVQEARNPQRDFGRALLLAASIIVVLSIFGSLAIAYLIPHDEVNLLAGTLQIFETIGMRLGIPYFIEGMAMMLLIGTLAQVNTWYLGPAKGLLFAGQSGYLPAHFTKTTAANIPVAILFWQAVIGSILAYAFLLMPSVSHAFWIMTALTTQLAALIYLFIFASAIRLRYTQPDRVRTFKVPGGNLGMWLISGFGFLTALLVFLLGFVPPEKLDYASVWHYEAYLVLGLLLLLSPAIYLMITRHQNVIRQNARKTVTNSGRD
jgi:amino acid transporter